MRKLLLVLLALQSVILFAQDSEDSVKGTLAKEVIVTGYPSEESTTPAPIEKVDARELKQAGDFKDVPNILSQLPSVVTWSQSGLSIGYSFANIRGFDQRRQSILVNGVPQNDPEDHFVYWIDMPDLALSASSIELQRGAGSAFYGPAAIGGSIDVKTMLSPDPGFLFTFGRGSYSTSKTALSGNSGLIDETYMIYGHLSQTKSSGYRNRSFMNFLSYHFSAAGYFDDLSLQLNFYGGPVKDGLDYYGIFPNDSSRSNFKEEDLRKINWSESFAYERRNEEREEFFQPHYELLSTWDISDDARLANTLFYIQGDGFFDFDGTWVQAFTGYRHSEYYRLLPVYGARYGFTGLLDDTLGQELTHAVVENKQFGWLPRFEWKHGESGKFSLGGEVRIHRSFHWGQLLSADTLPTDLPSDYHFYEYRGGKNIFTVYASEQYNFTEDLSALTSIQFVNQKYRFYDEKPFFIDTNSASQKGLLPGWTNYEFEVPFTFINPRIGLNYKISDNLRSFASFSFTAREPRLTDYYNAAFFSEPNFNRTQSATYDFSSPKIRPEKLYDYELGLTLEEVLSSGVHLRTTLGGYYMSFIDELIKTGETDKFGSSIVGNAESVLHYGLEFSTEIAFAELLTLSANITISHNEILEFSSYIDPDTVVGKTPIGFPPVVANFGIFYQPMDMVSLSISGHYQGAIYGDLINSQTFRNDPYVVFNAGATFNLGELFGQGKLAIKVQVQNLLNTLYTTYVESGLGFFVAAPRHVFAALEIGL